MLKVYSSAVERWNLQGVKLMRMGVDNSAKWWVVISGIGI